MRIAIFGTGGVGGYFGACLARAGEDVAFIARGNHLQALRKSGLRVDSIDGDFLVHPVKATSEPSEIGPVDLVIVGVKAWQVPEAARAMKPAPWMLDSTSQQVARLRAQQTHLGAALAGAAT